MLDEEWAFFERFILAVRAPNGRKPTNHPETVPNFVPDAFFYAIGKRSSNMMAS